jgi:hypothetical protein
MVQMMGLPGSPTPTAIQTAVDAFAAKHDGLGPIVIVADQLGSSRQNPGCADSKAFGGVNTYFNVDIPEWIRTHLRVPAAPADWTISGYSNGGACSFLYGAQHPEIWGSLASQSGEEWPGWERPAPVLSKVFGGSRAAFDANKPENVLAAHPGAYRGRVAVFTAGAVDHVYGPPVSRRRSSRFPEQDMWVRPCRSAWMRRCGCWHRSGGSHRERTEQCYGRCAEHHAPERQGFRGAARSSRDDRILCSHRADGTGIRHAAGRSPVPSLGEPCGPG